MNLSIASDLESRLLWRLAPGTLIGEDRKVGDLFADAHGFLRALATAPNFEVDELRALYTALYGFAVPSNDALTAIVRCAPNGIIEVGAGNGYWAFLLRERGVDVIALDADPGAALRFDAYEPQMWTAVAIGGPEEVHQAGERRALMLCWPDHHVNCASASLAAYRGDTVIYVGEGAGGCTADDAFFSALDTSWDEHFRIPIPQWPKIHDALSIYKRRPARAG